MIKNFLRVSKTGINLIALILIASSVSGFDGNRDVLPKAQDLDNYSFDFSSHKLPIAYNTYGTAV